MQNEKFKISMENSKFLNLVFNFAFLIFIFQFFLVIPSGYASNTDWSVHIKVSVPDSRGADGTVWNHLIAGVRDWATDGYDSAWDTVSMVEADDPVQSLFTHGALPEDKNNDGMLDELKCDSPEEGYTNYTCSLWRDIRSFGNEKVWSFVILSPVNGADVTIQWSFNNKPGNMEIMLSDLSTPADIIDMGNSSRYTYTSHFGPGKKYGIRYFEIRVNMRGLFIIPPMLPDATVDTVYNKKLSALGGVPVWSIEEGDLPPGMYINSNTGEITGTPMLTGSFSFTVRGDDPISGYSSSQEYTLNINSIPVIDITSLPDGVAGTTYSGRIAATGGSAPVTWNIKGNLPEGVSLDDTTGIVSGTLIVPGIYDFTATIKDANGATDSRDFRITVIEPDDEGPPDAIRDLSVIYVMDTYALLMWTAPYDDSMTRTAAIYDIRYREDCSSAAAFGWETAAEVNDEPRPQTANLHTYTLMGLKAGSSYCIAIKSMDASGHVSLISNTVTVSPNKPVSDVRAVTSSLTLRKGYNLISLPLIPVPNWRNAVFGPVVGDPVALYRWYSAYPGITPPQYYLEDIVMPGLGYLLYSPGDNLTLDIEGLKIEDADYEVVLQNGWYMIGTPYNETILLSDVLVKNSATGVIKPYVEAVKAGWIGNTVYQLRDGNYDFASFNDDPPAVLEPWIGYWIYVGIKDGVNIIFRRP